MRLPDCTARLPPRLFPPAGRPGPSDARRSCLRAVPADCLQNVYTCPFRCRRDKRHSRECSAWQTPAPLLWSSQDRMLACRINRHVRETNQPADGRHVHNHSAAAFKHRRNFRLDGKQNTFDVSVHDLTIKRLGLFGQRRQGLFDTCMLSSPRFRMRSLSSITT